MANCAIVGINWGDEGKGRMVDLLAADYDVVVRYQGGNNAGHTVVNEYGKFALHLLPSGIFRKDVVNVLGNGAVIDPEKLLEEIEELRSKGIAISPKNLKVSDRAPIVFPYHRDQDALEEARLADAKYGSTKRGIAPVYGDKYMKKTIMLGELFYPDYLKKRLESILEWKNLTLKNVYGGRTYTLDEVWDWLMTYGEKLKPFICDTGAYLRGVDGKKNILFEAQLGVLRDVDFGIYPLHLQLRSAGCLCADRRGHARRKTGPRHRRGEGLLHLRGRRPVYGRMVRHRRGKTPRSGRGIRRGDGTAPARGSHGHRRNALRRRHAGRNRSRPDQDRYPLVYGSNPRLRAV